MKIQKLLEMAEKNKIPKQNVITFIDIALLKMNVIKTPIIFWNMFDFSLLIGTVSVIFFLPVFFIHSKYPQLGILEPQPQTQTQSIQFFIFNSFIAGALIGCMLKSVFINRTLKKLKINSWNDL